MDIYTSKSKQNSPGMPVELCAKVLEETWLWMA